MALLLLSCGLAALDPPLSGFRDAAFDLCSYRLSVFDCLAGMEKAVLLGHFNIDDFNLVRRTPFNNRRGTHRDCHISKRAIMNHGGGWWGAASSCRITHIRLKPVPSVLFLSHNLCRRSMSTWIRSRMGT